jgi:lipopolysaccharide biosynthesis regulator YciM
VSALQNLDWTWPAIGLAFSLGVVLTRWAYRRWGASRKGKVNQEYFKGLNFLLNEEPDKAIEVFIKALEVDSETVELHLALGGLFRRKGQVDRATRLHQNLIARPNLTDEQRLQAIYELAHDYYKAGLLDRAENLFLELKESEPFRQQAIDGLSNIYEQEKEWQSAIDVLRAHRRTDRPTYTKQMSHFWCELAELAIFEQNYDEARKCLRNALSEDRSTTRAVLLRGELAFQQKDYRKAIGLWQTLAVSQPGLAELVVDKMISSYQELNDREGLEEYLVAESSIPKNATAFELWRKTLSQQFGEDDALHLVFLKVQKEGLSGPVANYLSTFPASDQKLSSEHWPMLLKDVLNRAKSRKIEYTCVSCGFAIKAMYWHCPNCGEWESFA